jgi:hypothetical protein
MTRMPWRHSGKAVHIDQVCLKSELGWRPYPREYGTPANNTAKATALVTAGRNQSKRV